MNTEIENYITDLVSHYQGIKEIWLIGSRANGIARSNSDWDFIVFANTKTLLNMKKDSPIHAEAVDLLLVFNAKGEFCKPWGSKKSGNLYSRDWEWRRISDSLAEYKSVKWVQAYEAKDKSSLSTGQIVVKRLQAEKVWPK